MDFRLPFHSFFSDEPLFSKLNHFRDLINARNFAGIKQLINETIDPQNIYDYLFYLAKNKQWEIFDFIIKLGINPNVENYQGKQILYALLTIDFIETDTVKCLISRGINPNPQETVYHPILAAINDYPDSFKTLKYLIHAGADLRIRDNNGNTVLMKAVISQFNEKMCQYICTMFMKKYSLEKLKEFINLRNNNGRTALELAAKRKSNKLIKYFIILGAQLPEDNMLEHENGTFKIFIFKRPTKESHIWIVSKRLEFSEFATKIINICGDWKTKGNMHCLRQLFKLPYPQEMILNAAYFACLITWSHDIDSIKHICQKEVNNILIKRIQKVWKMRKRNQEEETAAAQKIQKAWRHKFYKKYLDDSCPVCLTANLNQLNVYRLTCGHFVHCFCLNNWRRLKNTCPVCRTEIYLPVHV